uniref:Uncharacterized protein n=1 Tax=Knipowitschia caucasica TaxID=637954 RepID=A0AAV2M3P8_KNICA
MLPGAWSLSGPSGYPRGTSTSCRLAGHLKPGGGGGGGSRAVEDAVGFPSRAHSPPRLLSPPLVFVGAPVENCHERVSTNL